MTFGRRFCLICQPQKLSEVEQDREKWKKLAKGQWDSVKDQYDSLPSVKGSPTPMFAGQVFDGPSIRLPGSKKRNRRRRGGGVRNGNDDEEEEEFEEDRVADSSDDSSDDSDESEISSLPGTTRTKSNSRSAFCFQNRLTLHFLFAGNPIKIKIVEKI